MGNPHVPYGVPSSNQTWPAWKCCINWPLNGTWSYMTFNSLVWHQLQVVGWEQNLWCIFNIYSIGSRIKLPEAKSIWMEKLSWTFNGCNRRVPAWRLEEKLDRMWPLPIIKRSPAGYYHCVKIYMKKTTLGQNVLSCRISRTLNKPIGGFWQDRFASD